MFIELNDITIYKVSLLISHLHKTNSDGHCKASNIKAQNGQLKQTPLTLFINNLFHDFKLDSLYYSANLTMSLTETLPHV